MTELSIRAGAVGEPPTSPEFDLHWVASGETLSGIASEHGVSLQALLEANPDILHPDLIRAGVVLTLPPREAEAAAPSTPSESVSARPSSHAGPDHVAADWRIMTRASSSPPAQPATTDPRYSAENLKLGPNEHFRGAIVEGAQRTGLAPQTLAAVVDAEAAKTQGVWNPRSYNAKSHAEGLTQFTPSSWIGEAERRGSPLHAELMALGRLNASGKVTSGERTAVLALRADPRLSILAAAGYAQNNLAQLRHTGDIANHLSPELTAQAAYLAHHEGVGGARAFLHGGATHPQASLAQNVPQEPRRADLLSQSNGDVTAAYHNWLGAYIDAHIQIGNFMNENASDPVAVGDLVVRR